MEGLENGEQNLLRDFNTDNICSYLQEKYPSFFLKYELSASDSLTRSDLLNSYLKKISNDAQLLNSIAWKIYSDELLYPTQVGIDIIESALRIKKEYAYTDTYAALLYKSNRLDDAQKQAESAIELAKEKSLDYFETQQLLTKILEAKK